MRESCDAEGHHLLTRRSTHGYPKEVVPQFVEVGRTEEELLALEALIAVEVGKRAAQERRVGSWGFGAERRRRGEEVFEQPGRLAARRAEVDGTEVVPSEERVAQALDAEAVARHPREARRELGGAAS